jgi:hypothetical protein
MDSMQRKHRISLLVLTTIIALSVLWATSYSLAYLTSTKECGQCHTITGVLTLTSDAGGTIDATIGIPFTIEVYSTGYTGGDEAYGISVQSGWADNDDFSFTPDAVADQSSEDTNSNVNEITSSFEFTPLSAGSFTIRIWVAASGSYSTSLDISVSVSSGDSTPPSVDSPPDRQISVGDPTESITWNPSDENPNCYEILDNSVAMRSGSWTGSSITVMLDILTIGAHDITLTVWDDADNSASDTVVVTVVDGDPPTIDHPSDVTYDEGAVGNTITWSPYDLSPANYSLFFEGSLLKSNTWNASDETITVSVDGLTPGSYNYTILVTDSDDNSVLDTVFVHVNDITPPTIDSPEDASYAEGTSSNTISWNPFDLYPSSYDVFKDGELVLSSPWSTSPITISIDGLFAGVYNFTIVVHDFSLNSAHDTVFVTVYDITPPLLDTPDDIQVDEGSEGNTLNWAAFDLHPSTYMIYREGAMIKSGDWNSSDESISVSIDGLTLGIWNFTIVVFDETGLSDTDTVLVISYDGTIPIASHPIDIFYAEGQGSGMNITWTAYDLHPVSYEVLRNGTAVKSGIWNSTEESILVYVEWLPIAVYNYTLIITDFGGNTGIDTVFLTVFDTDLPYINHPPDTSVIEDSIGNYVEWYPLDLNPSSYVIYRDGISVDSGTWTNISEPISISVDGLTLGLYNYTIVVTDSDTNTANDTILVTCYDGTPPTVNSPADVFYNEGEPAGSLTWQPYDKYPSHYYIYRDGVQIRSGNWNSNSQSFSTSISGLAYGIYNFTFLALDQHGNSMSDTAWVTVLDGTPPVVADDPDVEYYEGAPGGEIVWDPTDLHPVSYIIYKDSIAIKMGTWNSSAESIEISIDGLAFGKYNYTLVVFDIGDNFGFDTVIVTVLDGTVPSIEVSAESSVPEGLLGTEFIWSPYDLNPYNYSVYQDGVLIKSGLWNSSSEDIIIPLHELSLGTYNFSLIVFDMGGNNATDLVQITIYDGTAPIINHLDDFSIAEGTMGTIIEWNSTDMHPSWYEIFIDGNLIRAGLWNSTEETISVSIDCLSLTTYQVVLLVYDIQNNTAYDSVRIEVLDMTLPLVDSPSDIAFSFGASGNEIIWTVSDLHSTEYLLYRDGSLLENDTWTTGSISISLDGLEVGTYNYTLFLFDIGGNIASDFVLVTIIDVITTTKTTSTEPSTISGTETTTQSPPPVTPPPLPSYVLGTWGLIIGTWVLVFGAFFAIIEILRRRQIL